MSLLPNAFVEFDIFLFLFLKHYV